MIKAPANYKTLEIAVVVKIAKSFITSDPCMPADFPPDELRKASIHLEGLRNRSQKINIIFV